jgi:FtsP/CotA-like multicopper oxidase with cupredoxin domain
VLSAAVRAWGPRALAALVVVVLVLVAASDRLSARGENDTFPQPQVRRSENGVLRTTLRAAISTNLIVDLANGLPRVVSTPTFERSLPGPTLRVRPGDSLEIDLVNDLPANDHHARMGAFPHNPFTINLHTHGLSVSPQGNSDNVLRLMEPGTSNPVRVKIPDDHPSGTFWYHPHKHGSVTYQLFGGMAGFLIVEGGPGTLDAVPEVKAATEVLMGFQVIRTGTDGFVPFVTPEATAFGTNPVNPLPPGLWSTLTGSNTFVTTNGVVNPTLTMRPGEVQRWRWLAAGSGEPFIVALQGHALNVIANDGITVPRMRTLAPGEPYVMASGQRADVLVKAGAPGVYLLQTLDPAATPGWPVVSGSGIDPRPRQARISFDTPPAPYPVTLATIVVSGTPVDMSLPQGPLPAPRGLPSAETMLTTTPDRTRRVVFENCGDQQGTRAFPLSMQDPTFRLPSCGWYYKKYDAAYWGGVPFRSLVMLRDDDDTGVPNPNPDPELPRINFNKEGLFFDGAPLFDDMIAGNFEEWTVINRSFSDHSFHIHQNPFLVTHVNGKRLDPPVWFDTILVPAAEPQPIVDVVNINTATFGSITFRTFFAPVTAGSFVMHCHMVQHEDIGMMQRVDIRPRPAETSGDQRVAGGARGGPTGKASE